MMNSQSTIKSAEKFHKNLLELNDSSVDVIAPDEAQSLYGLFALRVKRSPNDIAYIQYCEKSSSWLNYSWSDIAIKVDAWRRRLHHECNEGDRVAVLLKNCIDWVVFDLACQAQGVINVPLYVGDRADNMAYIIEQTQASILLIASADHWIELYNNKTISLDSLNTIVVLEEFKKCKDNRVISVKNWLLETPETKVLNDGSDKSRLDDTATIVYTSGTTGRPKGVMLSHGNILHNAYGSLQKVAVKTNDKLLSFLPLSHTFERTLGYYLPIMANATVQYCRSINELSEDLVHSQPNMMIAVPRIFERVSNKIYRQLESESVVKRKLFNLAIDVGWHRFEYRQSRAKYSAKLLLWPILNALVAKKVRNKFGGQLNFVICGGAPLSLHVAKLFIGLGINLVQGYGLTETSPVLSGNSVEDNIPDSIGLPLQGVQLRLGDNDELLAKGPNVMKGYWANEEATADSFTDDGWLKTGDIASISDSGHLYIVGRVKEILVLSNGEKVPPADIEAAIMNDSLFEQAMVIGEGRSFLSLIAVLEKDQWTKIVSEHNLSIDEDINVSDVHNMILERIKPLLKNFPGYAQIYKVHLTITPWTNQDDLMTPTLKLKRPQLLKKYKDAIAKMYQGH